MGKVRYCEKCGRIIRPIFGKKCDFCGTKMKILPEEMKQKYNIFNSNWSNLYFELRMLDTDDGMHRRIEELLSRERGFIMNEVANNPLFSLEMYKKQVEENRKSYQETVDYNKEQILKRIDKNTAQIQKEEDKQNCIPTCPICGSSNIKKITIGTRAIKAAALGTIGVIDDAGKTWKCSNCGSKF